MRPIKHTTFCITICVLIGIIFQIFLPAYGNNFPYSESHCLGEEFSKIIDKYIQYIDDSLKLNTHQDISGWQAQKDFCYEGPQIPTYQVSTTLPFASSNSLTAFNLVITSIITKIYGFLDSNFFFLILLLTITIIGVTVMRSYEKPKREQQRDRRGFTRLVKDNVLQKQNHKCDHCLKYLTAVDFHHKNGDRSDNSQRNCQALCPNCHAIKTRGLIKGI